MTGAVAETRPDRYKWIALSNTTLGTLIATINSSIILIALPNIFRGISLNPLLPANTGYLLWMLMGFMVCTAVLLVSFGRIGDMLGRVNMYTLGFAVFTTFSILLSATWMTGPAGAIWMILMRVGQGVGGAFLLANSAPILTDAFPQNQRGLALGINSVAAISGAFIGLVLGGVLAPVEWRLVFLVSVPFGIFGTLWARLKLRDRTERHPVSIDWWGNGSFAVGLVLVLVGITYGIEPYGGHTMGWTNPKVMAGLIGGIILLGVFVIIERHVERPMFNMSLFRIRAFSFGNIATLLASIGRGGLMFILIIWLQGIWLPQHGYSFEVTPLWAGIYMLPLTIGFLIAGPLSGILSDHLGARPFATGGMLLAAARLRPARSASSELQLHLVRPPAPAHGLGHGRVLVAQPGRNHEQPPARPAGRRGRDDLDLSELVAGAVDRRVFHADHPGFGPLPPPHAVQRPGGPGRAGRCRPPCGLPPPGRQPVRGLPRLQPHSDPARVVALEPAARSSELPDGPELFPPPDFGAIPFWPVRGVHLRGGGLPGGGGGIVAAGREVPPRRRPLGGPAG